MKTTENKERRQGYEKMAEAFEDIAVLKNDITYIKDALKDGFHRIDERIISYANDTKQRDSGITENLMAHDLKDEDREVLNAITRQQVASIMTFKKYAPYIAGAFIIGAIGFTKSLDIFIAWIKG